MSIITVGIDLAKNIFAVHGVDQNGKAALIKPKVSRDQLLPMIAQLPPCLIGMEACSGAHHWARQFREYGHTVKLMAPKFVTPYRMGGKRGKNDAADAAAICEAVTRAHMRFVPVKEEHQQIILCLHRTREGFVEERTATYNRLRGLIAEFGIVLPQKVACLRRNIGAHLEDLPGYDRRKSPCGMPINASASRLSGAPCSARILPVRVRAVAGVCRAMFALGPGVRQSADRSVTLRCVPGASRVSRTHARCAEMAADLDARPAARRETSCRYRSTHPGPDLRPRC